MDCTGGVIPKNPGSVITLSVIAEPIDPNVDRDYMVWLADLDGVTLNAEKISWSADQLELAGIGSSAVDAGRVKSVVLRFPQFDFTVSKFIDGYNDVFLAGLKKHEDEAIIDLSLSINAEGTLIIGNEDCLRKVFDLYQTDAGEIVTILERHFLIGLILDPEFLERGLSKTDQP